MKQKNSSRKDILFLLPSLLGVLIFVFLPFSDVIRRSFTNVTGEQFTGISNYQTLLTNEAFLLAVKNTGSFIAVCVPLLLSFSLLIACLINAGEGKFYRNICLLPMTVPIASLVFVWKMMFHRNGFINTFFHIEIDWINSNYAFFVLTASFIWKNLGYYVVLWLAGLGNIPAGLYEAANIDGATVIQRFYYITLPGLSKMISATFILALTGTLKSYREAYLLAGEYPQQNIYMIQHLFHNWFRDMSIEKMCAGAVILVCIFGLFVYPIRKKGGGNSESLLD